MLSQTQLDFLQYPQNHTCVRAQCVCVCVYICKCMYLLLKNKIQPGKFEDLIGFIKRFVNLEASIYQVERE